MPYSITTKDGITIQNIPDDVSPDAQELKDRVAAIRAEGGEAAPVSEERGVGEELVRQLGLTVRAGAEGGAGALGVFSDPIAALINQALPEDRQLSTLQSAVSSILTEAGIPEPEGAVERIVNEAAQLMAGAGGTAGTAKALSKTVGAPIAQKLTTALAEAPAQQVAAGAGAGAAQQTAEEAGVGPVGQAAAALAGGTVTALPSIVRSAAKAAPAIIEEVSDVPPEQLGAIIQKASHGGMGAAKAQSDLAKLYKVNPAAKAAADRLGIELPMDVFSDSPLIKESIGLTRSIAGSKASAVWRNTVEEVADKADEVMTTIDASPDLASVSDRIRESLKTTRSNLSKESSKIYQQVDAAVPKKSIVGMPTLKSTLDDIAFEVGKEGLSRQEKRLAGMLKKGNITYGRLAREKNLIGQAIAGKDSPYGNMEAGALKRIYGAMAEDQLDNVGKIGGDELRDKLRGANFLYAKERALGKRIVNAFGQDTDGSIASLIRRAIVSGQKGDEAALTKLLKVVPEDLQKETIATALMSTTRARGGAVAGRFGFSEYSKMYRGLRENSPIYAKIAKILGPDSHKMLNDLYKVSKRVTDARANVLTTGKANQALVESLKAEGLVTKVLDSVGGQAATMAAGAAGGGPGGAALANVMSKALAGGKKDTIDAAGKLFSSPEFQNLIIETSTKPGIQNAAIKRLSMSKAFRNFAQSIKLPKDNYERWVMLALQEERQINDQETP